MSETITLNRAVEVKDVVHGLQEFGLTQKVIAHATGASERSVRNWLRSSAIRSRTADRLQDLREIVLLLSETLTPRGVGQWLRARNRLLGGHKPIELLAARGESLSRVLA
jgi:hypothetical protein